MVLTKKQRKVLGFLGTKNSGRRKDVNIAIGISRKALDMTLTRVYQNFDEMLDVMSEYYPVFERRLKNSKTKAKLTRLQRKIPKKAPAPD